MTALALRNHLVFCLVTGCTGQFLVFEFACREQSVGSFVTGCAILGRCFITIGDVLRHMCLMTLFAVGSGLLSEVRLVTLSAVWNLAVGIMARAAIERSMLAHIVAQLDDLTGMAGHAGVGDVIPEFNIKRCVRIRVTAEAAGQFEVRFSFVALAAKRDDLTVCGRMTVVTVLAGDLGFVLVACCSDISWRFAVTFDTVIIKQFCSRSSSQGIRSGCRGGICGVNHGLSREKDESGQ